MKNLHLIFLFFVFFAAFSCNQQQNQTQSNKTDTVQTPAWAKEVVWYQIFVERFNNGDKNNDPTIEQISTPTASFPVPKDWTITPWTTDWYEQEPWAKKTGKKFDETLQHRRYGGDLQGIINKLDYLQELGVTALYLNPINDAPSLHKYDARNYHHIDVNFGPDPVGDQRIIASENPNDPSTWKWTAADKLFLKLVEELHKRNMRIVLDYSWNHTGVLFWAWQDIVKNQEKSEFKDWYNIVSFDNPATKENEFEYKGWLNIMSLPEIKKVNVTSERISGHPYEGNQDEKAKKHIFDVTKRWLAPDGDVTKGIDGYRLDVADQIPMGFWRDYHKFVKSINKDAYLVGEIWWEKWPDSLMNPVPYVSGDIFDAVMFYQIYRPARSYFANVEQPITAKQFADSLLFQWNQLPEQVRYAMMNVSATHDSPRLLSCFYNTGKYKYQAKAADNPNYKSGKPDDETYKRVKLYLVHNFTIIGAPHIWNGDEMGMWGGDDPDCRKPLWWPEFKFDTENRNNIKAGQKIPDMVEFNKEHFEFYKLLAKIRKDNPVLVSGKIDFFATEGRILGYKRFDDKSAIYVIFNPDTKPGKINITASGKLTDLLTGKEVNPGQTDIAPLSAYILK